ncbi:MAG: helix-turn-helix transcriptional regulator [Candidatus Tectomicrobia bacterium]|nr:helix-turn-helix transcriptional regulator [Candidatus Tectomicrobia bacterium]
MKTLHQSKRLPNLLRQFISRLKILPAEVSRRSGIPQPSLSTLLSGKRGAEDQTLLSIAIGLGLSNQETIQLLLASKVDSSKGEVLRRWGEIDGVVSSVVSGRVTKPEETPRKEQAFLAETSPLDWINEIIRGFASWLMKVQIVPTDGRQVSASHPQAEPSRAASSSDSTPEGDETKRSRRRRKVPKNPKKVTGRKAAGTSPPRRGRKPIAQTTKTKKKAKAKVIKIGQAKGSLPTLRKLFFFLHGKIDGVNLQEISTHFEVNRGPLKVLLDKLVRRGSLHASKGLFFLHRPLQPRSTVNPVRPAPIIESAVLDYLAKTSAVTIHQMAMDMGESSHHRLIRVVNDLKKAGKIVVERKKYWLATFVAGPEMAYEPAMPLGQISDGEPPNNRIRLGT